MAFDWDDAYERPPHSLVPTIGGKMRQAKGIISLMRRGKRRVHLIEAFCRFASVFFSLRPEAVETATLIDIDGDVANLVRVLASRHREFLSVLYWLPAGSREVWDDFHGIYDDPEAWNAQDQVVRAVRYYWLLMERYVGEHFPGTHKGPWRHKVTRGHVYKSNPHRLLKTVMFFVERLHKAFPFQGDALEELAKPVYSMELLTWYIDAPYLNRHCYYKGSPVADREWHARLVALVVATRARAVMSYDLEEDMLDILDPEWHVFATGSTYKISHAHRKGAIKRSSEVVVTNFRPEGPVDPLLTPLGLVADVRIVA